MTNTICKKCDKTFKNIRGLLNHTRNVCIRPENLKRNCPFCFSIVVYKDKPNYIKALKNNSKCVKCLNINRRLSDTSKAKTSQTLKKLYDSGKLTANMNGTKIKESRKKMADTKRGTVLSYEHKTKIKNSVKLSESMNKWFNSKEYKIHMSNLHRNRIGTSHSEETRKKMRNSTIERIVKKFGKFHPSFNESACQYFDKLMLENRTFIQHALNGGEFHIKELGYWVDGYDIENNIVYEWDEKYHYDKNEQLLARDIVRQNQITDLLKCKFIRIKESL